MKDIKYTSISSLESEIKDLIKNKQGFRVLDVGGAMSDSVRSIEREIESQNFKCRIYTAGRIAAAGGSVFTGVLGVVGAASAIGIAAHNLATYDPDFEIKKHKIDKAITVAYMR